MIDRLKAKVAEQEKLIAYYREEIAKASGKIELLNEIIVEETDTKMERYCDNTVCLTAEQAEPNEAESTEAETVENNTEAVSNW